MTFLSADPDSSSWELERQTFDDGCPEKAGRALILLLTNTVPKITAKTLWANGVIFVKSKNCLKGEHSTAGAGTFGRWEVHIQMERCTSRSYSRCSLVSDQPIFILLFLYLQTLCDPIRNGWFLTLCMQYCLSPRLRGRHSRHAQVWLCRREDTAQHPGRKWKSCRNTNKP